ncbi:MAG: MotA/TolQ/ExbB proton channel family protein [Planctomycetota bacterium]|jgi:biopolymer transport protein ExbB
MQSIFSKRVMPFFAMAAPFLSKTLKAADSASDSLIAKATYWHLLMTNGKEINIVLMFFGILSLFLFIHLLLVTRKSKICPKGLMQLLQDDIASGDIEKACQRTARASMLEQIVLPILKLHTHPVERLHQIAEGAGRRIVGGLRQKATYLANIGVLCPMIGLLGTVLGMITAFESFAAELDVSAKQAMLTAAIGKAMITTAMGLIVGIPSMAAYYFSIGKVNRISDELELNAENIIASFRETK